MNFVSFKSAVAKQFKKMQELELYRTSVDKDSLWSTYLSSFPEGSNPIYRERTEHDCSCCRQFIRAIGDVVAIVDNELVSIWDCQVDDPNYSVVAAAMSKLVKSYPIDNTFLHTEKVAGTDKSFEQLVDKVTTYEHFFVNIPTKFVSRGALIGTALSSTRALHDVLGRSLSELTLDAVDTVLELIAQNSLYRGQEHKFAVSEFKKLKIAYDKLDDSAKDNYVWSQTKAPASVCKIRNTSIGTLLVDLSEGKSLEDAVRSFEAMVAPANYKRPTALVTKSMIASAKAKIEELGLTSALNRRYATLTDITVNNVIYADRSVKKNITDDVFDEIASTLPATVKNLDKVEEVTIDNFIANIVPTAESIEVMFDGSHQNNLVSLIAPVDSTAGQLFKWNNGFSWSYAGDMADSIKERVKKAGGNVTGDLCCRLAWDYSDDLDFHMHEPNDHIFYINKRTLSRNGGMLDVDANGGDGVRENPVENIFYQNRNQMKPGVYVLEVNNYHRRSSGSGFEVEIEFDGQVHKIAYEKVIKSGDKVRVAEIHFDGKQFSIGKSLPLESASKTIWNIKTKQFHPVKVIMLSPNYWDNQGVGNKHHFFMLDGCINDGSARGFFNEFLKEELNQHRKVFEIVGSKMSVDASMNQLSGLGFSSTQRNSLICRVSGKFTRLVKVVF